MSRLLICLAFLVAIGMVCGPAAIAQTLEMPETPELTVSLEPPHALRGGAYVQGQLKLRVRVASKYPFEALNLRLPEIGGAEVLTLSKPRTRKVRAYAGDGYVFETVLALFPQRSGPMRILPVVVTGAVAKNSGQKERFTQQSESLAVQVNPIDPYYQDDWWLVVDSVAMTETWSKPPDELRVGDVVRREVAVTAMGVTAEHLPLIGHGRTRGISVTDAGRDARTELTPDGVVAHLRQAWDLRIDSDQVIHISPLRPAYWDPETGSQRRAAVPAKRLEPLPRDATLLTQQLMEAAQAEHSRRQIGLVIAIAAPAALLFLAFLLIVWTALPTRRDRELRKACTGQAQLPDCYQAILAWGRDAGSREQSRTVGQLQQGLGGDVVRRLDDLQAALFSARQTNPCPKEIAAGLLSAARNRRLGALLARIQRGTNCILRGL